MKFSAILFLLLFVPTLFVQAQEENEVGYTDSLDHNLLILKRYLSEGSDWQFTNPLIEKRLSGLIDFIENEPIDTIIQYFRNARNQEEVTFIYRLPENYPDSLALPGYANADYLRARVTSIRRQVEREYTGRPINVPGELLNNMEREVVFIPEGEGMRLFADSIFVMPDSLRMLDAIPDDMVQSPEDFRRILRLEEQRKQYVEAKRIEYNDSLEEAYKTRIAQRYRLQLIDQQVAAQYGKLADSVRVNNFQVLKFHNDQAVAAVNDSLKQALAWVAGFADLIDNSTVNLVNLTDDASPLVLSNAGNFFTRVWLKNRQNDSISVLVQNIDKASMRLVIEDGYTFSRFRQQAVKDFDFASLNKPSVNLDKVSSRYQAVTPWTLGGDGNVGFTQTYLSNWKKGGSSAMSILFVARTYANYSLDKIRWENSAEIRNGWVKLPGEDKEKNPIQKNDDKLKLTSRFGLSAIKKWYYSTEVDFETQFFNGYKYPNTDDPISAFMAPARLMFKVGLDYKPSKDFSLFVSPLTSKTVLVQDTMKIDQTNFGIPRGKRAHWEPGLHTDLKFKKDFAGNITFETKYRMFINYLEPRDRFEMEWENLLSVQLNDFISLRAMFHTIYDTKILFDKTDKEGNPVLDVNGNKIREPKLQLREFVTIGFSYKINRRVVRAREIR